MKNRTRIQLVLLFLSLLIGGVGTRMLARQVPTCSPAPMAHMAWWGGVYPEYCLPGAMQLVGEEEADTVNTELPVKVCFKYLTFLNE